MILLNFYSHYEKHKITLHWSTTSEGGNDYFTIERSMDGQNWSELDSIGGEGKSDIIQSYALTDEHPYFGTSYYRLKHRGMDDHFEWCTPLTAICNNMEEASKIKCYPHPFDSELKIRFHKCINKPTSIEISNMLGVVVYKDKLNKHKLSSKKCVLDLSAFPSGSYMVHFNTDSNSKTLKLITKR
jgi:hypothetical protein